MVITQSRAVRMVKKGLFFKDQSNRAPEATLFLGIPCGGFSYELSEWATQRGASTAASHGCRRNFSDTLRARMLDTTATIPFAMFTLTKLGLFGGFMSFRAH